MIRINLLAVERDRGKRRPSFSIQATQQKVTLACTLVLVVTGLGIGWWYWSLGKQAARIEDDIRTSQQEAARLKTIIQQVSQFEARKAQLEQRVALIEDLRKGQSGPVHLIDEVSRSLPDLLWLTQIKQNGADLTISGRCTTMTALSDFVGNLELGGYFKKPVEILDSQVESGRGGGQVDVIKFSVKASIAGAATPAS
jgi:type IV pilus assembly protein PilN